MATTKLGWREVKADMQKAKAHIEQAEELIRHVSLDDSDVVPLRFALSGVQSMVDQYLVQRGSKEVK